MAKLWTVYPSLFAWPPLRSVKHALERLSVAVLVAGAVFELATGLLNTAQWYPWPFSFVPVHYAVAWLVVGALVLHVAVKAPEIRAHWTRRSPGTIALPAQDVPDRRSLLAAVTAAVGAVTITTVGQSFTPLKDFILFAPRHPDKGPQSLPVNRTAATAGVDRIDVERYRLAVAGPRPYTLTLDDLRALPQYEVELPIACVEGWSRSARWTGVRVSDLVERTGAPCPCAGARGVAAAERRLPRFGDGTRTRPRSVDPAGSSPQRGGTRPRSRLSGASHRPQPAGCAADQVGRPTGGAGMRTVRVIAGVGGVVLMAVGASLLTDVRDLTDVVVWLCGAVVLHDAVIAPVVLLVGMVLVRGGVRGPVRGALLVAGALTAVALPVLLRPGRTANPSVLPLDYPRNWLMALTAVATVTALWLASRGFRRHRRRHRLPED